MLVSLFATLSMILFPVLGPELAGYCLGGAFLGISTLSLVYPLVRPASPKLPGGENWSKLCRLGKLPQAEGREEFIQEIAASLTANDEVKRHPILLGPTGVGKTETIKALVHAIERGEIPALAGKEVIHFNMADLVNDSEILTNGNRILTKISAAMQGYREKYILVFDEIHLAYREKQTSDMAEQLKSRLDPGGDFPFVIGITTLEEYSKDIESQPLAFRRRLKPLSVESMGKEKTCAIAERMFYRNAPASLAEEGVFTYLYEQTQSGAQPFTSKAILALCMSKLEALPKSDVTLKLRKETFKRAIELGKASAPTEKQKRAFLLLAHYFLPQMQQKAIASAQKILLNKEFVNGVLAEEAGRQQTQDRRSAL